MEAVGAIADHLYSIDQVVAADIVVVSVDLLLRGGEHSVLKPELVYDNSEGGVAVVLDRAKTGADQGIVALHPKTKAILRKWKLASAGCAKLFPISKENYARALDNATTHLGIKRITPHVFRHTGASYLAAPQPVGKGMPEADLALRGRWLAVKSVQRYYKPAELVKAQAFDSVEVKERGAAFWVNKQLVF